MAGVTSAAVKEKSSATLAHLELHHHADIGVIRRGGQIAAIGTPDLNERPAGQYLREPQRRDSVVEQHTRSLRLLRRCESTWNHELKNDVWGAADGTGIDHRVHEQRF